MTFGLQRFRWWTLLGIGGLWVAIVIVHVVVLSDVKKFLPAPSNNDYPSDGIATANFVLISLLFVAALSLSFDIKRTFTDIQKDIMKNSQKSQFENPLAIDAAENNIAVNDVTGSITQQPTLVKKERQRIEKVPLKEQTEAAKQEAEDKALSGLSSLFEGGLKGGRFGGELAL